MLYYLMSLSVDQPIDINIIIIFSAFHRDKNKNETALKVSKDLIVCNNISMEYNNFQL